MLSFVHRQFLEWPGSGFNFTCYW